MPATTPSNGLPFPPPSSGTLSVAIPVTSDQILGEGALSPVHVYNSASHLTLDGGDILPTFHDEDKWSRMVSTHRSKGMEYGKVVDMTYLAKKLAIFFVGSSLTLIDLLSDTYLCISLFSDESYANVSSSTKRAFLVFLVLSTALWLLASLSIALSFKNSVGYHDQPSPLSKAILVLCLTALIAFDLPMYLIAMPQRVMLVTDIRGGPSTSFSPSPKSPPTSPSSSPSSPKPPPISNSLFVLGYASRSEWKASTHYGLLTHLPTFLLEDIPLFFINAQISLNDSSSVSFTSIIALIFSLFGIVKKGHTIYTFCAEGMAGEEPAKHK